MPGSDRAFANRSSGQTGQALFGGRVTGQDLVVGRVMVGGRVIEGPEFYKYCRRNGMCKICGKVKVKEQKKGCFGIMWTDIPIRCDDHGQIRVYKGYCISPTCYTLKQVKAALGESDDPPQMTRSILGNCDILNTKNSQIDTMLDQRFFERIKRTHHKAFTFESYKAVYARSTMVLFSRKTRTPLAALTLKADDVGCLSMLTGRPAPVRESVPYFQGLLNMPDQTFTFTISNLSDQGMINFNILHTLHEVSNVDPGPLYGINEVNELCQNESYTIPADQRNNRRMILTGKTTIVKDPETSMEKEIAVTVKESEAHPDKPTGLYFYLNVVPDVSCKSLVDKFAEGTVWRVSTGFVRRTLRVASQGFVGPTRRVARSPQDTFHHARGLSRDCDIPYSAPPVPKILQKTAAASLQAQLESDGDKVLITDTSAGEQSMENPKNNRIESTMTSQEVERTSTTMSNEVRCMEESSDDTATHELEQEVNSRDVYQFLIQLDLYRGRLVVVRRGLQLLRQLVFETHREDHEKKYIFPQDSWCKTIKSAMSDHSQDKNMQEEGAKTIVFLASFSLRYKADLLRNQNAKEIFVAMETHPQVGEICCMALETLTRTKGTKVSWRGELIEQAVQGLQSLLSIPACSGKEWAILTLYNISCDETLPEDFIFEQIHDILVHNRVVESFAMVIQDDAAAEKVVEAAVTLLWRVSVAPENPDGDFVESTTIYSSDDLLSAIIGAMYNFGSAALHEATCGLLSSIDIPSSSADSESISWKQTLSHAIYCSLTSHTTIEAVQLAGLRALFNLFCDLDESVADLDWIVEAILFAMNRFHGNADLQAHGCQVLACICESGDLYKAYVTSRGGITAIAHAFRSHVVHANFGAERPPSFDSLKNGASAVLASLARSNVAVPVLLQDSQLLLDFQKIVSRDGLPPEGSCVRTCVVNLIAASLLELDDSSMGGGGSNENAESGYIILANMATRFLQDGNEEEVESLIASLHVMSCRASGVLDVILSAANGTGNAQLANMMQEYPANASMQENGCGILGNIYFRIPFQGQLDQSSEVVLGSELFTVKTHTSQEVAVMRFALVKHKTKAGVVKNACAALCNFVSGLMMAASNPEDAHLNVEAALLYSGVSIEIDHVLSIHKDSLETQKSMLRLSHAAVTFIGEEELQRWSGNLIAKIYETMNRYPEDHEIDESACSILARFVSAENVSIDNSLGNEDGLRALLRFLCSDNELVVQYAAAIISGLLQRVLSLSNSIVQIDEYFDSLIDCIYRFPDAMPIQAEVCLILATLATLNDVFVKTVIANHGGVTAVLQVMKSRRGNAYVQECACKALSGIAEGIPDSILWPVQAHVCKELMRTFESCENVEGIQRAILDALCELCERDPEYFVSKIWQANGIPLTVAAMSQNLESGDIQKAGCKLLWMLARESDENKLELAQRGGIQAIILAMMSHVTSTAVQKEALIALKHISRISANKEVLRRDDAMGAIRLSIWGNLEEPSVVCAALSALNDIAVDDATCKVATVSDDVISCVLRAMRTHPSNQEVQKIGCWLLQSYTYNHENLSLMRAEQIELFELLPVASSASRKPTPAPFYKPGPLTTQQREPPMHANDRSSAQQSNKPSASTPTTQKSAQNLRNAFASLPQDPLGHSTLTADTAYSTSHIRSASLDDTHNERPRSHISPRLKSSPHLPGTLHRSAPPIMESPPIKEERHRQDAINQVEETLQREHQLLQDQINQEAMDTGGHNPTKGRRSRIQERVVPGAFRAPGSRQHDPTDGRCSRIQERVFPGAFRVSSLDNEEEDEGDELTEEYEEDELTNPPTFSAELVNPEEEERRRQDDINQALQRERQLVQDQINHTLQWARQQAVDAEAVPEVVSKRDRRWKFAGAINEALKKKRRKAVVAEVISNRGRSWKLVGALLDKLTIESHTGVEEAQFVAPVGTTQAGALTYGQQIDVHSSCTGHEYAYEHSSEPTVLCMSIWEGMKFLPLSNSVEEELAAEVKEWLENEGRALIASLNAIFKAEICYIDLESEADTIVCTCGHQCLNHANTGNLRKCPMCQSPITAFVWADGIIMA